VLGAAAEFERELIRERSKAGRARYLQDFQAGRVGKTVTSRSGKNLAPHRPKRIFDRDRVASLRAQGLSFRQIAAKLGIGVGTAVRALQAVPKVQNSEVEH
jgi:Site-specific recombinases, DNA invertase Pin homologs